MADRKLTFVRAGDKDASEVTISTGTHVANVASRLARETYTISYPGGGLLSIKEKFADAAQAILDDAKAGGGKTGDA